MRITEAHLDDCTGFALPWTVPAEGILAFPSWLHIWFDPGDLVYRCQFRPSMIECAFAEPTDVLAWLGPLAKRDDWVRTEHQPGHCYWDGLRWPSNFHQSDGFWASYVGYADTTVRIMHDFPTLLRLCDWLRGGDAGDRHLLDGRSYTIPQWVAYPDGF